jgi:hypothetical protein
LAWLAAVDREGRTIFVADAHRDDGKRLVVHADEKLTAFLELETAIRPTSAELHFLTKPVLATQFAPQGSQHPCGAAVKPRVVAAAREKARRVE